MNQAHFEIEILAHTTRWGWGNYNNLKVFKYFLQILIIPS